MASHSLTASKLISWLDANTQEGFVHAATPSTESLAIIQMCLDAAIANIEAAYQLPDMYPVDVETAILMHAAFLLSRRHTPDGLLAAGEFGAVRVGTFDPTVKALLAPYWKPRFA